MFDVITIGGATQDLFIDSGDGAIFELRLPEKSTTYLGFDYGAKIEIDKLAFDIGGGATNAAVNFATLGFKTAAIIKIGDDLNAKAVLNRLREKEIDESFVLRSKEYKTGFSVILTSFEGDRTVLTHRGANSCILNDDINWEAIKNCKWIYIASLSGKSNQILDKLADFAEENGMSMAFNPGTAQIKRGVEDLRRVLSTAEVLIMNKSEALSITGMTMHSDCEHEQCADVILEMLTKLKSYGPKVVVITDGKKGVNAYDGITHYYAPPFPANVVSTLGAGDAFSSTFVAGLMKFEWDIEKSLAYASVNSASVVESFGAQSGLISFKDLEARLDGNKEYKVTKNTLKMG